MTKFFSKDPAKQLEEVKEMLYHQHSEIKQYLDNYCQKDNVELVVSVTQELKFYKKILDMMERS
jgi:uncharacterized protein YlbG (UPF0298 family)